MNRNDITVAVTQNGEMYIAQGNPAYEKLGDISGCVLHQRESYLYYSQLRYRVAWYGRAPYNQSLESGPRYHVGTPTMAKAAGAVGTPFWIGGKLNATGTPRYVGKVRR
jgi:hypothetical protein